MNKILRRANKRISLGGAATLLVAAALLGQGLGFLRTKFVNANFDILGAQSTDAYFAAFKIPDFFFFTVAAGALGVAFMPFLADKLEQGDKKAVWKLSSSLLNLMAIIMAIVGVIILVFADVLIRYVVAPGLTPEQHDNAVTIMRLVAFNPLLFTISGILTAVQQSFGRFFFYAMAPLFYNLSIIASIFIFRDNIGLIGLGIGALAGAVLQLLVIIFGMHGSGFCYSPKIAWQNKDFRQILKQLPSRSIDQGVDSINSIAETNFATRLGAGNLSYYENAYILHAVPIALIGTTISTAAFPRLTQRLSQGRIDLFERDFLRILRAMIWFAMPVIVVSYFARGYLARLIFSQGAPVIAAIFGFLVGAIFFRIIYSIMSRWFYAQKDTYTPLMVSLFTIALNIFLAYTLSRPTAYGVTGLAMAQSIVAGVEVLILSVIMLARDSRLFNKEFWGGIIKIVSVTGFSVLTAFIALSFLPLGINDRGFVTLGSKLGAITLIVFSTHFAISLLFGLEETKPILQRAKSFIMKPIRIQ